MSHFVDVAHSPAAAEERANVEGGLANVDAADRECPGRVEHAITVELHVLSVEGEPDASPLIWNQQTIATDDT